MKQILPILLLLAAMSSPDASATQDDACHPPYQPTNLIKLLLNYKPTMDYIATAPARCQEPFTRDLKEVVRSTWLMSDGCIKVTIEDIEKAEKARSSQATGSPKG